MKSLMAFIAIAAVLATAAAQTETTTTTTSTTTQVSASNPTTISTFATQNNLSWEDAAAAMAIARAAHITPDMVISQRGSYTGSLYDIAPAWVIASQSGTPVSDILSAYNSGKTWMELSSQYNVPAYVWNWNNASTTGWTNEQFTNSFWQSVMRNYYYASPEDITWFSSQSTPWKEVVVANVYGTELNRPVRDVYTAYTTSSNSWTTVTFPQTQTGTTEVYRREVHYTQTAQPVQQTQVQRTVQVQQQTQVKPAMMAKTYMTKRHTTHTLHRRTTKKHHRRHKVCVCYYR